MKKLFTAIGIVSVLLFGLSAMSFAATFNTTASMPSATGFSAYQVLNGTWSTTSTTTFAFGTLKEVSVGTNQFIFLPNVTTSLYFVILPTGGGVATTSTITASWTETSKPVGQTDGLGTKTTIAYTKVVGTTETELKKCRLQESSSIIGSQLGGGSLRMYVGIYNGVAGSNFVGTAAVPFTAGDVSGSYGGTLTISLQ